MIKAVFVLLASEKRWRQ